MPGICTNVRNFLRNHGAARAKQWTLSWEPRDQSTGRNSVYTGYCKDANDHIKNKLYRKSAEAPNSSSITNEFPFTSSQEGGKVYYRTWPSERRGITREWVPF